MKEVVVVLPCAGDRILMQLRDECANIDFPGHWGFFGGSIDAGESAAHAAVRELREETGYSPENLHYLRTEKLWRLDDLTSHSFYCRLSEPLANLNLNEGMDWGLFSVAEVRSERLRSDRFGRNFPVIPHMYVVNTISDILDELAKRQV